MSEALELLEVVEVVAGHGFDDGPEGHGASLGVSCGAVAVVVGDGGEKEEVPVADGVEESERGFERVDGVALSPGVLVEGLDDVVGLVERGGKSLTEAEGEDEFGVGEVGDDVCDAPLAWGGWGGQLGVGKAGGEGVEALGGAGEDGNGVVAVEVFGVGV